MILQEATYFKYGYYPYALKPQSHKLVLATCDNCGKVRGTTKHRYSALCKSCAMKGHSVMKKTRCKISEGNKGKKRSDEQNCNMRKLLKGKLPWNKAKTLTKEHKRKIGEARKGKKGKQASRWLGGKVLSWARSRAKRRSLGFNALNAPFEGSEGHHLTHNSVAYIPSFTHQSIAHNVWTAKNMQAVNALAIDFLLNGF